MRLSAFDLVAFQPSFFILSTETKESLSAVS